MTNKSLTDLKNMQLKIDAGTITDNEKIPVISNGFMLETEFVNFELDFNKPGVGLMPT
jgi:hypothetical protein